MNLFSFSEWSYNRRANKECNIAKTKVLPVFWKIEHGSSSGDVTFIVVVLPTENLPRQPVKIIILSAWNSTQTWVKWIVSIL